MPVGSISSSRLSQVLSANGKEGGREGGRVGLAGIEERVNESNEKRQEAD